MNTAMQRKNHYGRLRARLERENPEQAYEKLGALYRETMGLLNSGEKFKEGLAVKKIGECFVYLMELAPQVSREQDAILLAAEHWVPFEKMGQSYRRKVFAEMGLAGMPAGLIAAAKKQATMVFGKNYCVWAIKELARQGVLGAERIRIAQIRGATEFGSVVRAYGLVRRHEIIGDEIKTTLGLAFPWHEDKRLEVKKGEPKKVLERRIRLGFYLPKVLCERLADSLADYSAIEKKLDGMKKSIPPEILQAVWKDMWYVYPHLHALREKSFNWLKQALERRKFELGEKGLARVYAFARRKQKKLPPRLRRR